VSGGLVGGEDGADRGCGGEGEWRRRPAVSIEGGGTNGAGYK
jgi:hypothetical protein